MKRIVTVTLLLPSLALSSPTRAQPGRESASAARADELLRVGLARYEAGDFAGAVSAFEAGYSLDPRPAFLFAAAQAERRSGDCARAVAYYDRFLATSPPQTQADAAREQRARCIEALPASELAPPSPRGAPAPAVAPPVSPPSESAPRPWYTDPLTDALVGGSAALLLVGAGFSLSASSSTDEANGADTYDGYGEAADRAELHRTIGLVSLAGGAAVGVFAAWRILRHDSRPEGARVEASARTLQLGPGPGVGVAVVGAF